MSQDPRMLALRDAIKARDPFYSGICAIPDHQRLLYYTHGDLVRRIDVSEATSDDLGALYRACRPAEFGRGRENVFDESYRKAGNMDLKSFSMLFDPRSLGIHEQVSKALLPEKPGMMDMELYKLNVYGEGDFFKAHKDTPRDQDMFGSLVVVLPTPHEGGQLVLRQDGKEWTVDFTDKFASAKGPLACYVAFYSDIEHEVFPVTSGYRVTLTYNLYRAPALPTTSSIPTPHYLSIKEALVSLVNDKSILPNGGYLGFGLVHEYVHTGHNILDHVLEQLKGSDRALADVCDALGLRYMLRLFYRDLDSWREPLNLLTTKELEVPEDPKVEEESRTLEYLEVALKWEGLTIREAEIVEIDNTFNPDLPEFSRDPPTQVMEITKMKSSADSTTSFVTYGNDVSLKHFYGTACMLVALEPAASRQLIAAEDMHL